MRAFILFGRGEGVEPSCHSQMDEQGAGLFFMGKEDQEILAFSLDAKDLRILHTSSEFFGTLRACDAGLMTFVRWILHPINLS